MIWLKNNCFQAVSFYVKAAMCFEYKETASLTALYITLTLLLYIFFTCFSPHHAHCAKWTTYTLYCMHLFSLLVACIGHENIDGFVHRLWLFKPVVGFICFLNCFWTWWAGKWKDWAPHYCIIASESRGGDPQYAEYIILSKFFRRIFLRNIFDHQWELWVEAKPESLKFNLEHGKRQVVGLRMWFFSLLLLLHPAYPSSFHCPNFLPSHCTLSLCVSASCLLLFRLFVSLSWTGCPHLCHFSYLLSSFLSFTRLPPDLVQTADRRLQFNIFSLHVINF